MNAEYETWNVIRCTSLISIRGPKDIEDIIKQRRIKLAANTFASSIYSTTTERDKKIMEDTP